MLVLSTRKCTWTEAEYQREVGDNGESSHTLHPPDTTSPTPCPSDLPRAPWHSTSTVGTTTGTLDHAMPLIWAEGRSCRGGRGQGCRSKGRSGPAGPWRRLGQIAGPIGQIAPASRMAAPPQPTRLDTFHVRPLCTQHPLLGRRWQHRRQSLGGLSRLQAQQFAPPAAAVALHAPNTDFQKTTPLRAFSPGRTALSIGLTQPGFPGFEQRVTCVS